MLEQILNPANWQLLSLEKQLSIIEKERQFDNTKDAFIKGIWNNSKQTVSPLTIYKYLKARFGEPNGLIMFLRHPSSDNLIHWQYSFIVAESVLNVWGKTSGLEISINNLSNYQLKESDWQLLIDNIQNDYKNYKDEMKAVQSSFEHWSLFINPFPRIEGVIMENIHKLERLNLNEPNDYTIGSRESYDNYLKALKRWINNIAKAASYGTTIRMLCPVMVESFINLILLVFRRQEYACDERLYDSLTKQQIDIRVKTLHLSCTCFPKQIDTNCNAFKNFHSLMNRRNDVLHGNIEPKKLVIEDVWFDNKFIPLFDRDEGVIRKMMKNYCFNVEPEKALGDFQSVSDFIELILMCMDDESLLQFVQIMADKMPGINKKSKRLGVLFASEYLVENHPIF